MPAKRHSSLPGVTARIVLSAGTAVLVSLFVWMAIRAVEPSSPVALPQLIVPELPLVTPSPVPSPSLSTVPAAAARPSSSSARPRRSPALSRSPSASSAPSASRTSTVLAATLAVPSSWQQGYVAAVTIRNTGDVPRSWTVTVTHRNQEDLDLRNTWNASGTQSGAVFTFTGGPLAPGATATFGYQASKSGSGNAGPSGCTVVGGRCRVS